MPNGYLSAEHEPVASELTETTPLRVVGELPEGLLGLYVRNSPNPQFEPVGKYHWFDGDGMVHGVRFKEGRASYLNRWVRTADFEKERQAGRALWSGILERPQADAPSPLKNTANTDLVFHHGKIVATWWLAGTPYELDPKDLSTSGPATFGGQLTHGMSAHPKVDPRTGELVFFDFSMRKPPFMRYGVVNAEGRLTRSEPIDLPTPHILHDMAITERHSVLMDFPLGWDAAKLKEGKRRIAFDRGVPSRFGVMPRHGRAADVKWFEAKSCYMYHSINAYEDGEEVVLNGCRVADLIPEHQNPSPTVARLDVIELVPHLYEWRFNLKTGAVRERQLDDLATEFPRMNDGWKGVKAKYGYNPRLAPRAELMFDGVVKYDLDTGRALSTWNAPRGWYVGEASFAEAPDAQGEDHGWLVTFGTNAADRASAAFVLDAREMNEVAVVHLPQRIPLGFHSYWCPRV